MRNLFILAFAISISFLAHAEGEKRAAMKADAEAINSACSADAQTCGCAGEKVGKGLLKCMHGYKKSHKDFKFSDSCKSAMEKMHADRKGLRAEKKEKE